MEFGLGFIHGFGEKVGEGGMGSEKDGRKELDGIGAFACIESEWWDGGIALLYPSHINEC